MLRASSEIPEEEGLQRLVAELANQRQSINFLRQVQSALSNSLVSADPLNFLPATISMYTQHRTLVLCLHSLCAEPNFQYLVPHFQYHPLQDISSNYHQTSSTERQTSCYPLQDTLGGFHEELEVTLADASMAIGSAQEIERDAAFPLLAAAGELHCAIREESRTLQVHQRLADAFFANLG